MIKKTVAVLLLFILSFVNISEVSADKNRSANSESVVKEFLCTKMYSLVSSDVDKIDGFFSTKSPESKKYMLFTKQNLLLDYIIAYAANDYVVQKVKPEVEIIRSVTKENLSTVEANLRTEIFWNSANALGEPIVGMNCEKHLLMLNKERNQWKIVSDKFMTDRGYSEEATQANLERLSEVIDKLKKEAQTSIIRARRSKSSRLTLLFYQSGTSPMSKNDSAGQLRTSTQYNRDAAYSWAHTCWNNYSKAYVNLGDEKWEGGDCTNFISQCLRAGGSNNLFSGPRQWYYDGKGTAATADDSYSWTWSMASGLNSVILGNYKAKSSGIKGTEKIISNDAEYTEMIGRSLSVGDIIQYEWAPDSKIKHSAIIVGMVENSAKKRLEPVISTHSFDSWNLPWTKNAFKTHFITITGIK